MMRHDEEALVVQHALRIERFAALAALALAIVAGFYIAITTFAEHEACYGMSAGRLQCQVYAPDSPDFAMIAARAFIVLSAVLFLFAAGAAAAWWQARTTEPTARSTAYGVVVTCTLLALGITLPAIQGAGFFFLPSTVLLLVAAVAGLIALLRAGTSTST